MRERVPQAERTRAMRLRLLEATVDSLADAGWSGTSTTKVSERAGVSRGAQLHHFPTRNDLLLATAAHLERTWQRQPEASTAGLIAQSAGAEKLLEALGELFTGPLFAAVMELSVGGRTDPALQRAVAELDARVGEAVHERLVAALGVDESVAADRALVLATVALLRGVGAATALREDDAGRRLVLDRWAAVLEEELG